MKKMIKRLALTKDTISSLDNPGLREAFGGWGTMEPSAARACSPARS